MAIAAAVGVFSAPAVSYAARTQARFEPPDGTVYMGVSQSGTAAPLAAFDTAAGMTHPAIYQRYTGTDGPLGPSLADGSFNPAMTMMISWNVDFTGGQITSGADDAYLAAQVAAVRAYAKPVFLRLDWEMNDNWFSDWSAPAVTPAQYIASWQYIVNKFAGVANVAFVWSPGCGQATINGTKSPTSTWYPGDRYVDWVGLDCYPQYAPANWLLNEPDGMNAMASFAQSHGKPLMLAEWSPNLPNPDTADPIDLVFQWAAAWPTTVKALVYFDYNGSTGDHLLVDHPVGAAEMRTFTAKTSRYLTSLVPAAPSGPPQTVPPTTGPPQTVPPQTVPPTTVSPKTVPPKTVSASTTTSNRPAPTTPITTTTTVPVAITTSVLAAGQVGQVYSLYMGATGGVKPYTWSSPSLPAGMTLSGSHLSGTPRTAGTQHLTITVTANGCATSRTLALVVKA